MPGLSDLELGRLYQSGLSLSRLADVDGRSETTLYKKLRAMGVQLRPRSLSNRKFPTGLAVALYNMGLSCSQIGTLLGVHPTTVLKRLQDADFPLRPPEVAAAVAYTDEEFRQHFRDPAFVRLLHGCVVRN